ncbi:MAG: hypothetical protein PUP91_38965 [Rhizonema sp. PD37]|nr:hypothetical protein [Rhizonema sp. PD37]
MKAGLKRIEATLHDLEIHDTATVTEPISSTKQSFSFRISVSALQDATDGSLKSVEPLTKPQENLLPQNTSVQTFPVQEDGDKVPSLPKFKTPNFTSHRNAANPALAMNLLLEIQQSVTSWQRELQKIIQQIQDIYLEGPIVNGWLESHEKEQAKESEGTAALRHAEVNSLMGYVEEICTTPEKVSCQLPRAGYSLCGLDANGKVWSRPCPPDQVVSVSMAIARYQKLRQLLGRKQYLETRLSQLAESLIILRGHIKQA